jgi:hypothetical protein
MTVAELIKKLKKLPPDAQVLARNVDTFEHTATSVRKFKKGYVLIDASEGEEFEG